MTNMIMQLDKEIEKVMDVITEASESIVKKSAFAGARSLIRNSPVFTSAYVLSHRVVFSGETPEPPIEKMPWIEAPDPWSPKTKNLNNLLGKIKKFKLGQTIIFSNSVGHATAVEFGVGFTPPYAVYLKASNRIRFHLEKSGPIK